MKTPTRRRFYPGFPPLTRDRDRGGGVVGLLLLVMGVVGGIGGVFSPAHGSGGDLMTDDGPEFVAGFEDMPLPPGMMNLPGSQTVFDSREGRILDAIITGPANDRLTRGVVRNFYRKTLPQLGWQNRAPKDSLAQDDGAANEPFSEDHFVREGEALVLRLERIGDVIQARFTLTPIP